MDSLQKGNKNSYYSSPENQLDIYNQASDVYAVGVLFYELATLDPLEEAEQKEKTIG